jgi:hypothetical protein
LECTEKALDLLDDWQQSVNLIVSVGETGLVGDGAINPIVAALKKKNCRLLRWQLYAADSDNFNNFVLQLGNIINAYADSQVVDKRKIILYANQFCGINLLRDAGNNFFILDYPYTSLTQGGFLFPEKEEILPLELSILFYHKSGQTSACFLKVSTERLPPSAMLETCSILFLSIPSAYHRKLSP